MSRALFPCSTEDRPKGLHSGHVDWQTGPTEGIHRALTPQYTPHVFLCSSSGPNTFAPLSLMPDHFRESTTSAAPTAHSGFSFRYASMDQGRKCSWRPRCVPWTSIVPMNPSRLLVSLRPSAGDHTDLRTLDSRLMSDLMTGCHGRRGHWRATRERSGEEGRNAWTSKSRDATA
jgi:hypothetical protein